jgi:hypothetical protein
MHPSHVHSPVTDNFTCYQFAEDCETLKELVKSKMQ